MNNQESPQKANAPVADVKPGGTATTSSKKTNVLAIVAIIFAIVLSSLYIVIGLVVMAPLFLQE